MNITTRHEIRDIGPQNGTSHAQLWVFVSVNGEAEEHSYVYLSGPKADVQQFVWGELTLHDLKIRWKWKMK